MIRLSILHIANHNFNAFQSFFGLLFIYSIVNLFIFLALNSIDFHRMIVVCATNSIDDYWLPTAPYLHKCACAERRKTLLKFFLLLLLQAIVNKQKWHHQCANEDGWMKGRKWSASHCIALNCTAKSCLPTFNAILNHHYRSILFSSLFRAFFIIFTVISHRSVYSTQLMPELISSSWHTLSAKE